MTYVYLTFHTLYLISTFHTLNFQSPSPQVGLVRPHTLNLQTKKLHIHSECNFSERKGLKTGGGVELAGLLAPSTLYTSTPSTLPLPFPFPNYTAGNLEILPDLL